MTKQTKTKIGVGFVVKAKVGELENITREERIRRMRKEVVGCVQILVGKKNFLVLFEDGQKKDICSCLIVYLSEKEEVEMEDSISHLSEKEEDVLLNINGDPEVGEKKFKVCICLYFIICVMIPIYLHLCPSTRWRKREIRT